MKSYFLLVLVFFFLHSDSFAQKLNANDLRILKKKEDSLKIISAQIIRGITSADRFNADSIFTRMFVRALKINNSFSYPFDSLISISKLSPKDSSFKIFTWQMNVNDEVTRQHGAIQMRTKDGSLKLYPLIDKSDVTVNMIDTAGNNFGWIGAVYYRIIEKEGFGKKYYTLLGYDENNINSNKKIVEVLYFNNGEPTFGGPFFSIPDNDLSKNFGNRLIMQYKKNASPRLTYDEDMDMIIFEHLIPEPGSDPNKKYSFVGDGDYDGLKWKEGKWMHIEKVYTQRTREGDAPVPNPVRDDKGNIDETKLKQAILQDDENIRELPAQKKVVHTKKPVGKE